MKQTVVYVMFAGADKRHTFDMPKSTFLTHWNDNIIGCGYYTGTDNQGNTVIINPSQCGLIEITEVEQAKEVSHMASNPPIV